MCGTLPGGTVHCCDRAHATVYHRNTLARAAVEPRPHTDLPGDSMIVRYGLLLGALILPAIARAQTAADSSAIRATALDYAEGWYDGNAERMSRAVHPEL